MIVAEAEGIYRQMLQGRGVDLAHPDPRLCWEAFKEFASVPANDVSSDEPDADGLLFQFGVYDLSDGKGERFNWNLTRQFTIFEDGEYDHMEQFLCDFFYEATAELRALGEAETWSFGRPLNDWFAEVEGLDGFRVPIENHELVEAEIRQEQV